VGIFDRFSIRKFIYVAFNDCSAPLKSSHLGCLLRAILGLAPKPQGAMGPFLVVPVDPVPNDLLCLLKRLERVLPDTLVFQARKNRSISPFCQGV
jgi:hypothetical protein